jgi:hypothetical protein
VADNGQLKSDNTTLREALARYQAADPTVKSELSHDLLAHGKSVPSSSSTQHQIKMGNLLTIGSRSTATAGVCLLVSVQALLLLFYAFSFPRSFFFF